MVLILKIETLQRCNQNCFFRKKTYRSRDKTVKRKNCVDSYDCDAYILFAMDCAPKGRWYTATVYAKVDKDAVMA